MAAPTRSTVAILASTSVNPGGTKASPALVGPWVDVRGFNGGDVGVSVKNGASAPGAQGQYTLQGSDKNDGTNVYDIHSSGGNTTAGGEEMPLIELPNTVSYVRLICYGHTTNAVTFKADFFAKA